MEIKTTFFVALLAGSLTFGVASQAVAATQAEAKVDNNASITIAGGAVGAASGVSAAGAKTFKIPKEQYVVSTAAGQAAANATELPILKDDVMNAAEGLGTALPNNPVARDKVKTEFANAANKVKPIPAAGAAPAGFTLIPKKGAGAVAKLTADAGPLNDASAAESAHGVATQEVNAATVKLSTNIETRVVPKPGSGYAPTAAAFGINRDPLWVDWIGSPSLEIDLSDLSLHTEVEGEGYAAAYYGLHGKTMKPTMPMPPSDMSIFDEDQAMSLFNFSFLLLNNNGAVVSDIDMAIAEGMSIFDNLGHQGLDQISDAFDDIFSFDGVDLKPSEPWKLTLSWQSPSTSVLWLNDEAGTVAHSVPVSSPGSLVLLSLGLLGWAATRRRDNAL